MTRRPIDVTGKVWIDSPPQFKTQHDGEARRIYIGPRAQEVLRPWLRTELDAPPFQPIEA